MTLNTRINDRKTEKCLYNDVPVPKKFCLFNLKIFKHCYIPEILKLRGIHCSLMYNYCTMYKICVRRCTFSVHFCYYWFNKYKILRGSLITSNRLFHLLKNIVFQQPFYQANCLYETLKFFFLKIGHEPLAPFRSRSIFGNEVYYYPINFRYRKHH